MDLGKEKSRRAEEKGVLKRVMAVQRYRKETLVS